ncbi:hypothetical protein GH808_09010 [Acetobacterium fimetarium]|uniref:Uncharacterized protein n=1 Tax=Acetobacterium fimetarium TaxID=52691 RepID=A0ABR6WVV8_9FIRM|nr:hypothetical protein [Acetobacterium fimetarium]MBC3804568.1 hypothetical protein [Acetobacterium fimetarium]
MKVKYIGETDPVALIKDKIYEVLSEEHDRYRIVDDEDEDYLYPKDAFEIIGLDIIVDTPDYTKTKEEEQERFRKLHGIKDKK